MPRHQRRCLMSERDTQAHLPSPRVRAGLPPAGWNEAVWAAPVPAQTPRPVGREAPELQAGAERGAAAARPANVPCDARAPDLRGTGGAAEPFVPASAATWPGSLD